MILLIATGAAQAENRLTLEECRQLALKNNILLKNSQLESESAEKNKNKAFTHYFPKVSAGAMMFNAVNPIIDLPLFPGISVQALDEGQIGYVSIVQPVFAGGRIVTGNKLADLGKQVSKLKKNMVRNDVLLKAEEQYWQIVSLYEKKKTILRYEALLGKLLNQVSDAYQSGLILKTDVLQVRQKKSEIRLNKSKLENGIQLATMAFCQYIGIDYDPSVSFSDQVTIDMTPEMLRVNARDALKNRVEYKLLRLSVKAETLMSKLELGKYLPEAAVGAGAYYAEIDDFPSMDDTILFAFTRMPISALWEGAYSYKERKIQEKIAVNNANDKTELLLLQMEKAWRDVQDAYKQMSLSEISRSQAEENLTVSQDSFDNGLVDVADLLQAQAVFQQAEDQLTEARINCRIKQRQYLQVTGRSL